MSEASKRQPVIMGIFVAGAVAILAGGVIMIGGTNDVFSKKISASVVFDDVSGLKKGDNVWFSGVQVGVVKGLELVGDSQVRVDLKIEEEAAEHIHADALAKLGSDGLIGNKLVVLYEGTADAPLLTDGAELKAGKAVSTQQIIETLQANNENLLAITGDMKTVTARMAAGEGSVGKLLADDTLYTSLTATVASIEQVATNAQALTASLQGFAEELNEPGNLPHDLVTDQTTYQSLMDTVSKLEETSVQAATLMEGLAKNTADPNTPAGALLTDPAAAKNIKTSLENLNTSSALLAKELDALQYNFLLRRPLKKQQKAQEKAAKEAAD